MPPWPFRRLSRPARTAILVALPWFARALPALADTESAGAPVAEPTSAQQDIRRAAENHFQRGLSLARTPGGWEAALGEFLESRRLYPTRSATRNAAVASKALGRYSDALELYDTLLSDFASELGDSERSTYQAERRALLDHFGRVTISLAEPGASVVVDGRERGITPLAEPLLLQAGTHVVQLAKDGFRAASKKLYVAAGSRQALDFTLAPLSGARILIVQEVAAEQLDVVLDAATVGKVPWRGNVSAGLHSVLLRGPRRGTAPMTVDLRTQPSLTLTLRAVVLDAEASITPVPASATIYIDDQFTGSGGWIGALPSGPHRVDVIAPDHLPFRQEVVLRAGTKAILTPHLAPNRAPEAKLTGFYLEPNAGLAFGRTLRGGVDDACDCDSRERPFGWTASLRAGYSLLRHFAPELSAGYLRFTERSTRTVHATTVEPGKYGFVSHDERDSVAASGAFMAVGAAARFFTRFPVTARLSAGAALLGLSFSNAGTFSGYVTDMDTGSTAPASGRLSIYEPPASALIPFFATELRVGYAFARRFSADLGVSVAAYFPPTITRAQRSGALSGSDPQHGGVLILPDEVAMRTFLLLTPSLALRVDL